MATLISAVVQGMLAGIGYYVAGWVDLPVTALTMLFTLVPVVGSAIVWAPVCLWLFAVEGAHHGRGAVGGVLPRDGFDGRQPGQAVGVPRPLEPPSAVGAAERARRGSGPRGRSASSSGRWSSPSYRRCWRWCN